jgi:hypothetical protein
LRNSYYVNSAAGHGVWGADTGTGRGLRVCCNPAPVRRILERMRKRFINYLFALAYGHTVWTHEEALKREWLEKGYERGQTANRRGCPFNLYLARSNSDAMAVPEWRWWGTVDPVTGVETCLGPVERLNTHTAFSRYVEVLNVDTLRLIGLHQADIDKIVAKREGGE